MGEKFMKKSKIPYVLSWVFNILYMGYSFLVIFNIVFFCCSDSVYFDPHYPFQASQIWEAFLFLVGVLIVVNTIIAIIIHLCKWNYDRIVYWSVTYGISLFPYLFFGIESILGRL